MSKKRPFKDVDGFSSLKKWYEEFPKTQDPVKHKKTDVEVLVLQEEAKKCFDAETNAYQMKQNKIKDSEFGWLKTALSKGTTSDKIAANVVLIQNSPKHNLNNIKSLVSQVRVAKHNQCNMLITTLRDLFLTDLLHPQFKLLKFSEQNLDQLDALNSNFDNRVISRNKLLSYWYFEDQLKDTYERFVTSLSVIAGDTVDSNREKAVSVINDLLMGNPEQEQKLLDFLINKIGDPNSKVASKAVYCLNKLLYEHPNMKIVILKEVEKFLFRSNISSRAQYFAVCLLSQFVLRTEDEEVASYLINVYLAFFKASLKKGEPNTKMMAAILSGINRAYKFAKLDAVAVKDHIDSVYKVVHVGSFNTSLNALSLLYQLVGRNEIHADRFYNALYKKLLDPEISTAKKQSMFLNLLYRSLRTDHSIHRLHAFVKRVLQVALYFQANMAAATLYTVSQILQARKMTGNILVKWNPGQDEVKEEQEILESEEEEEQQIDLVLSNVQVKKELQKVKIKEELPEVKNYDIDARNPLFAGAKNSCYFELSAFARHYHPTVSLFAKTIIDGKPIAYDGNPLEDLSLIRFLDRFVYRNPKKLEDKQVRNKVDPFAFNKGYQPKGVKAIPVNSEAYINAMEGSIPVDEKYLYDFMKKYKTFKSKDDSESDNDSVTSEDFNKMLDESAMVNDFKDLDIAGEIKSNLSKKPKGKTDNDEDQEDSENSSGEDEEDLDSLSDEEGSDIGDDSDEELCNLSEMDDDDASDLEFNDSSEDEDEGEDSDAEPQPKRKQKQASKESKKPKMELDSSDEEEFQNITKKIKQMKGSEKNKKHKSLGDIFASAEEFSEILENEGRSKFKFAESSTMKDADGAGVKQLDWEVQRNRRMEGYSKKKKSQFKGKKFGKKDKFKRRS